MKYTTTAIIVTSIALGLMAAAALNKHSVANKFTDEVKEHFESWKAQHGKTYFTEAENLMRLSNFAKNLATIKAHNESGLSWKLGVNHLSDLTHEEFKANYLGFRAPKHSKGLRGECASALPAGVPASIDHTTLGGVNPIQNQGQCGSCWAFSATASIEYCAWKKDQKTLLKLAEQELVDCAKGVWGDLGCNGGMPDRAFRYTHYRGMELEKSYPYTAKDGKCVRDASKVVVTTISHEDVTTHCPTALMSAVSDKVISVAVDAEKWMHYKSGIFAAAGCGTQLDHAVNAVGYGTDDSGANFIKIRNSWTTKWGELGYIRLANDMKQNSGTCGVLLAPSYPTC